MKFDSRRTASLDGTWEFYPGDHALADLPGLTAEPIEVPGLWEAQGHVDLDGPAWYRRRFHLDDVDGGWSLRFGAVMDLTEVWLNGRLLGRHELPFTPLVVDPAGTLCLGDNDLAVRVVDPSVSDPDHRRMAHGKQGWANHAFPSRPSLYMTYGGIWQSVTLRRHGALVITDVFVDGNPEELTVTTEIENRGPAVTGQVGVRTLGRVHELDLEVPAGGRARAVARFGATTAPRWRPAAPVLHHATVDCRVGGALSDSHCTRYGLRTVRVDGTRLLLDGEPYRMKSLLVQGFRADRLYAEGDREQIRREVEAAAAMGANTLRLHIKAFDPTYLDVCDELGMLLHCDVPVAEPIVHEEMGGDTVLGRRCLDAARAQVRRDRNHPSVVLWSAMNEICDGNREARRWPAYEAFARALAGAVADEDPTRPVIENDWVEPDPERVFASPILTAHWYGRLHRDYLDALDSRCRRWAGTGRPLLVTEFGDWGLPEMPLLADPPFWDTRAVYAADLAATLWPGTVGRFAIETQRYQGLSDRLQAEVLRRHDHVAGYCLTELTDVPYELNGVLDLHRRPKPLAVTEVARANQVVLPMLRLESLVAEAGATVRAPLVVANDDGELADVAVEVRFGESAPPVSHDELLAVDATDLPAALVEQRFRETAWETRVDALAGHSVTAMGGSELVSPEVPGSHDLIVRLRSGSRQVAVNRYPIHVVAVRRRPPTVRLVGGGVTEEALRAVGAGPAADGTLVVGEGALDASTGAAAGERLSEGGVVVVLAQGPEAVPFYPVPVELEELTTVWGSTVFRFTTDHGALPSLPRRAVLTVEDSTIQASCVVSRIGERAFPDAPVVIAYKPVPGALIGTVVGSQGVGRGRLVVCQYRLAAGAAAGDAVARALLADVLSWAGAARPVLGRETLTKDDGRRLIRYSWHAGVAT